MKYVLGFAMLVLLSSASASAQRPGAGFGGGAGGSIGGGASRLPIYPSPDFQALYVTGSDNDFEPSTFRSYDQAVKEGQDALSKRAKTLAEIAKESRNAVRPKAKVTIEQDNSGRAIIEAR